MGNATEGGFIMREIGLFAVLIIFFAVFIETRSPQIIEKKVIKEVPVEKIVEKEVLKEVPVEVVKWKTKYITRYIRSGCCE